MTELQALEQRVLKLEAKVARLRPTKAALKQFPPVVEPCKMCGGSGYLLQAGCWVQCECKVEETRALNAAHGIG